MTPTWILELEDASGNVFTLSSFNFDQNNNGQIPDGAIWIGSPPPDGTVLTVIDESNPTRSDAIDLDDIFFCYAKGSVIPCEQGPIRVEELQKGMQVTATDGALHEILWVGKRHIPFEELRKLPALWPIELRRDGLAPSVPNQVLRLSPEHRILLQTADLSLMTGFEWALSAAKHFTALEGVSRTCPKDGVTYYHIMCRTHVLIEVSGLVSETLFLGDMVKTRAPDAMREELRLLFPELFGDVAAMELAAPELKAYEARALAAKMAVTRGT
ncbi:MAG: Hint domain-containing protein [Pseudomonadota bacterium]